MQTKQRVKTAVKTTHAPDGTRRHSVVWQATLDLPHAIALLDPFQWADGMELGK